MSEIDDVSSEHSTADIEHGFDWQPTAQPSPVSITFRVDRRTYHYLKSRTLKDVKEWRKCDGKWTKKDQQQLFYKLQTILNNKVDEDDRYVTLRETYKPPTSGFPGRLYAKDGVQCLMGCIRANFLKDTADADMRMAMHCVLRWVCPQFGVEEELLSDYVENRDDILQSMMDKDGVSKAKAKELYTMIWTSCTHIRTRNEHLKRCDIEAKAVQEKLMKCEELKWILPYCKDENRPGSFIAHLYQWIEGRLLDRVYTMLRDKGFEVAALIFDGMNLMDVDRSLFGNAEILKKASQACEEVCPGINMIWAWKELDFTIKSKDTLKQVGELRVPDDYEPPPPPSEAIEGDEPTLDPDTEPTYEELRAEFSLNHGEKPGVGHGKVGSEYIEIDAEGTLVLYDKSHLMTRYCQKVYFELKEVDSAVVKVKESFIGRWMHDERMDPRYLKDKSKRYCWDRFDMYPKKEDCPDNVYNLWPGYAAELMEADLDDPDVHAGLLKALEHLKMLCNHEKRTYDFLLDLLSHGVQYPNVKVGIMICLVGKQGCGKGHVWEMIERLVGHKACFTTQKPDKDVWGDNNGKMKNSFFVRVTEANKSKFAGFVGELRTMVTDSPIRVRDLYCTAANVKNFTRFFLDTNYRDAIPDEHGERRFFIIDCNEEKIGDSDYFEELQAVLADDRVIRALYEFLKQRSIKPMYLGKDIPVGAYQRALKDSHRSVTEQFIFDTVWNQDVEAKKLKMTADELFSAYKGWQEAGSQFERSKASITRELELQKYEGITRTTSLKKFKKENGEDGKKQGREYTWDLEKLRKRYPIDTTPTIVDLMEATAGAQVIDCKAEIAAAFRGDGKKRAHDEDEFVDDEDEFVEY